MADLNENLGFSTDWVTDMGLLSGSTTETVANGTGSFDMVTHDYGYKPVSVAHYKVSPGAYWYDVVGAPTFTNTFGSNDKQAVDMYVEVTNTKLVCHYDNGSGADRTITVRYWVYENDIEEEVEENV